MMASEILRSMKTRTRRAYVIIGILTALLILTNVYHFMH